MSFACGPLREVTVYVWDTDEETQILIPALEWWDGTTIDDGRHIKVAEAYEHCSEPDYEILICGHMQPIKVSGRTKRKYYNRRRRCVPCAMEGPC